MLYPCRWITLQYLQRRLSSLTWGKNSYSTHHVNTTQDRNPKVETKDKAFGPPYGPGESGQAGPAEFEGPCFCDGWSSASPVGHSGPHSPDFQRLDKLNFRN